jgi:hypothetical protein
MKKQICGLVGGVIAGCIVAFCLQALDLSLWLCLLAGIALGLEAGYFTADPREALRKHGAAMNKVNIELHLPQIDWTNKDARSKVADVLVTILAGCVFLTQIGMTAGLFVWLMNMGHATKSFGYSFAGIWVLFVGLVAPFFVLASTLYRGGLNVIALLGEISGRNFRLETYRLRVLCACAITPVATWLIVSCGLVVIVGWIALSLALLPVYIVAALCSLTRGREGVAMSIGIVADVIVGFIYGYSVDFALAGEALACGIGAVAGLAAGALTALIGHEKVGGWIKWQYGHYSIWDSMTR